MPLIQDGNGRVAQVFSYGASQEVAVGSTSAASAVLAADAVGVRLVATTACYVVIGSSADAATGGFYLPAGQVELVGLSRPGVALNRVAVRRATTDGTLNITELF